MQNVKQPTSPTPSLLHAVRTLKKYNLLEGYEPVSEDGSVQKTSPPSSLLSVSPKNTDDAKELHPIASKMVESGFPIEDVLKALPSDERVRQQVFSRYIRFLINAGQLSSFVPLSTDGKALTDSWRNVKSFGNGEQLIDVGFSNVDLRLDSASASSVFSAAHQATGRCVNLNLISTVADPQNWNRQSNLIEILRVSGKFYFVPIVAIDNAHDGKTNETIAPTGIANVMLVADTFAFLSNSGDINRQVILQDQITSNSVTSTNVDSLFSLTGTSGITWTGVDAVRNACAMRNPVTSGSRFHILYHRQHNITHNKGRYFDSVQNVAYPQDGHSNGPHELDVKFDPPIKCPYADEARIQPYMNSLYLLVWQNNTQTNANRIAAYYQVRTHFRDIGVAS